MEYENLNDVNSLLTPKGRANTILIELSERMAENEADECLMPNTSVWLYEAIAEQIQNAIEVAGNDAPTD